MACNVVLVLPAAAVLVHLPPTKGGATR